MTTAPQTTSVDRKAKAAGRIATRHELTRFYRAIGIPAVISAMQATKMTKPANKSHKELPAFLRDAHAIG